MEEVYLIWAMHIEYQKAYFAPYYVSVKMFSLNYCCIVRLGGSATLAPRSTTYNSKVVWVCASLWTLKQKLERGQRARTVTIVKHDSSNSRCRDSSSF